MKMRVRTTISFLMSAAAGLGLAVNEAQAAETSARSFLEIIRKGAEWPGAIIAALSLAAVTIIIEHFWAIRRATLMPDKQIEATRQLIEGRKFRECMDYLKDERSMFADVLTTALRHGRHGFDAMHEAAEERAAAWSSRLFRKVEYLSTIGHLAPLMGLLGTVLGMIRAFSAMQETQGAYRPENLSGGISLALVNTFLGLGVAIIALGFFGVCRSRVDALTVAARAHAMDMLEYFRPMPQPRSGGASAPRSPESQPVKGEAIAES